MWKFLIILAIAVIYTKTEGENNAKLKALEDIQEQEVDKVKQKEAESMSESLVKSYEFIMKAASEAGRSAYLACFTLQKSWSDKTVIKVNMGSSITVNACIIKCWEHRQRFAALWSGNECWCLNIIRGLAEAEEAHCSSPCVGNRTQVCGGKNRCSIYYTGYVEEPLYTHLTHKDINTAFQGCCISYRYRDKCTVGVSTQRMSVPMCMDLCESNTYQFASISKKSRCCCDPNLTPYRHVGLDNCRMKCPFTGSDYNCGDNRNEYFAVYRTGIPIMAALQNVSIPKEIWMEPDIDEINIRVLAG